MLSIPSWAKQAYWLLAGLGGFWALFLACLTNPTFQGHAVYMHKVHSGFWHNTSNPELFGFAKGQVTPFWLNTLDGEKLFCWHVLPLDVYLEHEQEIVQKTEAGVAEDFSTTIAAKLLRKDVKSRVIINFNGNGGHVAQVTRPSLYHSMAGIPHAHLFTCEYRGFGKSSLTNPPHIPTEAGLITDGISLTNYITATLKHSPKQTVLLGHSLGTAVTAATALHFTSPSSPLLPSTLPSVSTSKAPQTFAAVILVAPFTEYTELLYTLKLFGFFPVFSPLAPYPKIARYLSAKILDKWPTQARLEALIAVTAAARLPLHVSLLHARNDQAISWRMGEALYAPLEAALLAEEGVTAVEERRTIHGGERVRRGAFAYKRVEDANAERVVEAEIVRFGGHNEVLGWSQVGLAVRRVWKRKRFVPGLDVE